MRVTLDWDWASRTGGNLSPQEYRYLVGVLLRDMPNALAAVARYRMGRRGDGRTELTGQPVPQFALARRAEEFAKQELSTHVLAHSYRTYFFGKVLAAHDGVAVNDEIVYLAALLHDLQLEHPTPGRCFAVTGAERAAQLLEEWGADSSMPTPSLQPSAATRPQDSNTIWPTPQASCSLDPWLTSLAAASTISTHRG